jgi:hypothetical protein
MPAVSEEYDIEERIAKLRAELKDAVCEKRKHDLYTAPGKMLLVGFGAGAGLAGVIVAAMVIIITFHAH